MNRISSYLMLLVLILVLAMAPAFAQNLNWYGQTGALSTPVAYVTASPAKSLGAPTIAFHGGLAGDVIGFQSQTSITVGAFKRIEFGFSHTLTSDESAGGGLFRNDFSTLHAKVNILPENFHKLQLPAVSVGFVDHIHVTRVADMADGHKSNAATIYMVGTKMITAFKPLPFVVSGGVKGSNAVLFGLGGVAQNYEVRGFGTAGIVVKTPFKGAKAIFGAEVDQQPRHLRNAPTLSIPTELTYFARVMPIPERPINFDFAVAQLAGRVAPGQTSAQGLRARSQFCFALSYRL